MIVEPSSPGAGLLDTPGNIKAKIESGAFDLNVTNALKLDYADNKLNVSQPKDSTFLKFTILEPDNDKQLGVRILNQFFIELTTFYKHTIDLKKGDIDRQMSVIANAVKSKHDSIRLTEGNLKITEAREKELINELKDTKVNTEQLIAKRNLLLESKAQSDEISSLLYLNTIQQNMNYVNQLSNQLSDIKARKENAINTIETLQIDINNVSIEVEKLKTVRENIRNIVLIQEPRVSPKPTGPQRRRIVLLAGMVSLMAGAFLAFFLEFMGKIGVSPK
jgi:hypothetical protein